MIQVNRTPVQSAIQSTHLTAQDESRFAQRPKSPSQTASTSLSQAGKHHSQRVGDITQKANVVPRASSAPGRMSSAPQHAPEQDATPSAQAGHPAKAGKRRKTLAQMMGLSWGSSSKTAKSPKPKKGVDHVAKAATNPVPVQTQHERQRTTLGQLFKETPDTSDATEQTQPERQHKTLGQLFKETPNTSDATEQTQLERQHKTLGQLFKETPDTSDAVEQTQDLNSDAYIQTIVGNERLQGPDDSESAGLTRKKHPAIPLNNKDGSVALDAKGKVTFEGFYPPVVNTFLSGALAKPGMTYLAKATHDLSGDTVLLEPEGHLLQISRMPTAVALLRSSEPFKLPANSKPGHLPLRINGTSAEMAAHPPQPLPDQAHLAYLSGAHQDASGQYLRLHDEKLYRLDASSLEWKPDSKSADTRFSNLAMQGDKNIYARDGDKLINLSSPDRPEMILEGLVAHAVSPHGTVAMLAGKETQTLQLGKMGAVAGLQFTLELNDNKSQAASVGLTRERLFVSDKEGQLYSAALNTLQEGGVLKLMPEKHYQPAHGKLGDDRQITGFMSDDDGKLHALIKHAAGHTHSNAIDEERSCLKAGWNLSDVSVIETTRGLAQPKEPKPEDTFDLDRNGRIGLVNNRVCKWDSTAQAWKNTDIKDIDRVQRGLNSSAYVLKDGKLSALKVAPDHVKSAFSETHSLARSPRVTKVEMGAAIEGLDDRTIKAFAMVNDKEFAVIDDQKRLTAHHKTGAPTDLPLDGLMGDITHLALDHNHDLFATTSTGELFSMVKKDWQSKPWEAKPEGGLTWKKVPISERLDAVHTGPDNAINVTLKDPVESGTAVRKLEKNQLHPVKDRPADKDTLTETYERLLSGTMKHRMWLTRGAVRVTGALLGRSTLEQSNKSSYREYARAHIFKATAETPRPVKNAVYYAQHRLKGRAGLKEVYAAQAPLMNKLNQVVVAPATSPDPEKDLKTRIAQLNLGAKGKELITELENFREELENHSFKAAITLGQSKKLLNESGLPTEKGARLLIKNQHPLNKKQALQNSTAPVSMNNLLTTSLAALEKVGPSAENPTSGLLGALKTMGMKLEHLNPDKPENARRDRGDDMALTKARLALDIVTLNDLKALLTAAETMKTGADNESQIQSIKDKLVQLRETTYGQNPIKQTSTMGFTDHEYLEKTYNGITAFTKGFRKSDHAISVNLRAATGSKDQPELAQKLKELLKQLQHPDDELSITRGYGAGLSTPFASLPNMAAFPWISLSAGGNRNYTFAAERGVDGIEVYLFHEGGASLGAGVGIGVNALPFVTSDEEFNKLKELDIGNDRTMPLSLRLSADVSGTLGYTARKGVAFTVPDDSIDQFVDDLFGGKHTVMELLNKGTNHKAHEMRRYNVDINASGTAEFRVQAGLTKEESTPLTAAARLGGAAIVNVNLLSYTNQKLNQKNDNEKLVEQSQNRPRFFNTASITGLLRAGFTAANVFSSKKPGTDPAVVAIANNTGISGTAAVDSRTTKRIKFQYKEAVPLKVEEVAKLSKSLAGAFLDKASQAELTRLSDDKTYEGQDDREKAKAQLKGLQAFFEKKTVRNDEQYAALRDLNRALVQQEAAINHYSVLENGRFESNYTNLSRINEQSIASKAFSLFSPNHSKSNAETIQALMDKDPELKALVKDLQAQKGTVARVRLEPKDHVFEEMDKRSRDGSLTESELFKLLNDRDNMRIKAIAIFDSVTQSDGFGVPVPVLDASSSTSMSVNKTLAKINFSYDKDQDKPKAYTLDGEITKATNEQKQMAQSMHEQGLALKS